MDKGFYKLAKRAKRLDANNAKLRCLVKRGRYITVPYIEDLERENEQLSKRLPSVSVAALIFGAVCLTLLFSEIRHDRNMGQMNSKQWGLIADNIVITSQAPYWGNYKEN